MANPTTYFGWVMPTSSSLVTNLPADFNTFGQGVDTSLQDLLGGTTGQVLSKTSATNMDFTWVTPTDQTPLTTKGDLFTFSTVDARLGVGTNGQTLVADSTASTGLKWATPAGGGKVLQVVGATTSTTVTVTSGSLTATGLTATITPTLATSKILVIISQLADVYATSTDVYGLYALFRGATNINEYYGNFNTSSNGASRPILNSLVYYDSPATTSATTYSTKIATTSTGSGRTAVAQTGSGLSTITLLEIGA